MILLDTHAWIRWLHPETGRPLPEKIQNWLEGANEIVGVSLISCLEVSYLVKGRRLELTIPLPDWFDAALSDSGIELIIPAPTILYMATTLPDIHKDPADRIIIATALDLKATLVTADETIRKYPGLVWVWDQIPEK